MFLNLPGLCAIVTGFFGLSGAVTIGPVGDLLIVNKDIAPDGFNRPSTLADTTLTGGTFPGPVISGRKGDRFKINVTDALTDTEMLRATTIHWHGIFQNGTNYADGPAMVTQCPIVPEESFVYDFNVFEQAGTFWYHSHYSVQYCDGLRGAFIVYDPEDPNQDLYDVDDGQYHQLALEPFRQPATTLINGLGRTSANDVLDSNTELAIIKVTQGRRYRFRIIGLSCNSPYNFTIHDHNLTIIETDGEYTIPLTVDSFWVFAGQRYSVILHADKPINNYWIRANPLASRQLPGFEGGRNSAILRYDGAPDEEPTTNAISTLPLNDDDLHNRNQNKAPGEPHLDGADIVIPIRQRFNFGNRTFEINNVSYVSPTVPVLLQILNGTYDVDHLMPKGSIYKLKPNSSVELQIYGLSIGGPVSKHALLFNDLEAEFESSIPSICTVHGYNWENPVVRDTVATGVTGNLTVIRFFTNNSGPWFLHWQCFISIMCISHIDWHLNEGLAIVFAEDPEGTEAHNRPIPPPFHELCPKYDQSNPDKEYLGF
ncbi:hypothetical protein C0995_006334 [Termitomyces sp. Mi166|nr:hypothetical protein C0995_006334 [Termitomyces sp. Mi166\